MDFQDLVSSYAQQFAQLREEMLTSRLKEILGPDIIPEEFEGRLCCYYFHDMVCQIHLDGQPILQMEGPDVGNSMACIWKTANFRTS